MLPRKVARPRPVPLGRGEESCLVLAQSLPSSNGAVTSPFGSVIASLMDELTVTVLVHGRMARGGHELPKVSPGPTMPYPSMPYG
jgi:hypothetical protein